MGVRILYRTPTNCILTLILISINQFLNIIYFTKKKMVFLEKNSQKSIYQVLNNFIGLSSFNSTKICKKFGFQKTCTVKDLDSLDLEQLKNYLTDNFLLDKSLIGQIDKNVKNKIDLGTYKGKRHNLGYPVRGQRTLSNGKTQRNLHKFRFYYNVDLFSHSFFKNKRKSFKNKKIAKLKSKKKNKKVKFIYKKQLKINNRYNNVSKFTSEAKRKADKLNYLKKLNKIKAERKKQVDVKLNRDFKEAQKTHPYFLNIKKGKK